MLRQNHVGGRFVAPGKRVEIASESQPIECARAFK
jgi:hypothetical protein